MKKTFNILLSILIPVLLIGIGNTAFAGDFTDILAAGSAGVNEIRFDSTGDLHFPGGLEVKGSTTSTIAFLDSNTNELFKITDNGATSTVVGFTTIEFPNGELIHNQTDGTIAFEDDNGTNTLMTIVDNGTTGNVNITGALDVQGGTITMQNDEVIDNSADGTVDITDGTNSLLTIVDAGTTGNVTVSGTLTVTGETALSAYQEESVETFVAGDTLTAAETGKHCALNMATDDTITLPTAAAGLKFIFSNISNNAFSINPNGTDRIMLGTASQTDGDSIISEGAIGECIILYSYTANRWQVESARGNFYDND